MEVALAMTIIGEDRTGLVQTVARVIEDHGGNWLESRMCRLGGEFAGLLRTSVQKEKERSLMEALKELQSQGLTVIVHPDRSQTAPGRRKLASLDLVGHDRPGIVRQISAVLAGQGVNVEELDTECTSAPMSGETLFKATARLQLPETCAVERLRGELEKVAADLLVDISLEEIDADVKERRDLIPDASRV